MIKVLKLFERGIVWALLLLMMLVVLVSVVEVAGSFFRLLMKSPRFLIGLDNLLDLFGAFMMGLIGLELLETMKAYLREDKAHAEIVFLVALVAVARKVIIVDYATIEPVLLFGIAAVIVALGAGYYLVRRAMCLDAAASKSSDLAPR